MVKPKPQLNPRTPASRPASPPAQRNAPHQVAVKAKLQLPNERDESVAMTAGAPDPLIEQAAVDVARGLQDTSKAVELNRAYTKLK